MQEGFHIAWIIHTKKRPNGEEKIDLTYIIKLGNEKH